MPVRKPGSEAASVGGLFHLKNLSRVVSASVTQITHGINSFERLSASLRLSVHEGMVPSFNRRET